MCALIRVRQKAQAVPCNQAWRMNIIYVGFLYRVSQNLYSTILALGAQCLPYKEGTELSGLLQHCKGSAKPFNSSCEA